MESDKPILWILDEVPSLRQSIGSKAWPVRCTLWAGYDEDTQVNHYYMQRLMQKEFWTKLLRGGVAFKALAGLMRNIRVAASATSRSASSQLPFQQRMAAACDTFAGDIVMLLSSEDYTAKEFLEYARKDAAWNNALTHPRLVRHDLQGADHTCSSSASRDLVMKLTLGWLERRAGGNPT